MRCLKCGSMLPEKANFCPQCGEVVEQEYRCTNGHRMTVGQRFCCECGAPLSTSGEIKEPRINTNSKSSVVTPNKSTDTQITPNKMGRFFAKAIVTLLIMIIVAYIALEIGGIPSYIPGIFCVLLMPNIWKFIDEMY